MHGDAPAAAATLATHLVDADLTNNNALGN
jgi:hypothetical protein